MRGEKGTATTKAHQQRRYLRRNGSLKAFLKGAAIPASQPIQPIRLHGPIRRPRGVLKHQESWHVTHVLETISNFDGRKKEACGNWPAGERRGAVIVGSAVQPIAVMQTPTLPPPNASDLLCFSASPVQLFCQNIPSTVVLLVVPFINKLPEIENNPTPAPMCSTAPPPLRKHKDGIVDCVAWTTPVTRGGK
jgi:hypothetical protein